MPWYNRTGSRVGKGTLPRGEGVFGDVCCYRTLPMGFSAMSVSAFPDTEESWGKLTRQGSWVRSRRSHLGLVIELC